MPSTMRHEPASVNATSSSRVAGLISPKFSTQGTTLPDDAERNCWSPPDGNSGYAFHAGQTEAGPLLGVEMSMSLRQCEIAAEASCASLLARAGYNVLVQYGPNQPQYDQMAEKQQRILLISVKGSQEGGWMLAVKYREKGSGTTWHQAIDKWRAAQREDCPLRVHTVFWRAFRDAPRVYCARPDEIADHLKLQHGGTGYGVFHEDTGRTAPGGKHLDQIPPHWAFTEARIDSM